MFSKVCPWCEAKITLHQLGQRPAKPLPKWYQFSRNVKVCPYCAGAVKLGGRGIWFAVLIAPLFMAILLELSFGIILPDVFYAHEILYSLCLLGFLGVYFAFVFEKVEGV